MAVIEPLSAGTVLQRPPRRIGTLAWLAVVALAAWAAFSAYTRMQLEDALITYRYAANLAAGHGFVFNPGERVFGTTTPLFTFVLALVAALGGSGLVRAGAACVAFAAALATVLLMFDGLRRCGIADRWALAAAAIFAFNADTLWMVSGGMETALVIGGMAASFWALSARRHVLAAGFAALVVLVRIDGLAWYAATLAFIARTERRRVLPALGLSALVLAPWTVFSILYFGSAIPQSVHAKTGWGSATGAITLVKLHYVRLFVRYALVWLGQPQTGCLAWAKFVWLAAVALGATDVVRNRARQPVVLFVVFPPLFLAGYYIGRAPPWFPWYGLPVTWCGLVLGTLGMRSGLEWLRRRRGPGLVAAGALLLSIALLPAWGWGVWKTAGYQREFQENEEAVRRRLGEWVAAHTGPGATVATESIGYEGFYSGRRVIDLAGLVTPSVVSVRRGAGSEAGFYHELLRARRPDVLVLRAYEVDENKALNGGPMFANAGQRADFFAHYAEAARFAAPHPEIWGGAQGGTFTVYTRRD